MAMISADTRCKLVDEFISLRTKEQGWGMHRFCDELLCTLRGIHANVLIRD